MDSGQDEYVILLVVQREVGVTRETLRKYLLYLEIEPICFHMKHVVCIFRGKPSWGVKQLKQNPTLLHRLKFPMMLPEENTIHGEHGPS